MSNTTIGKIIIITITFLCIGIFIFSNYGYTTTKIYDCREAHWHPDVPKEVKEQCRELIRQEMQRPKGLVV